MGLLVSFAGIEMTCVDWSTCTGIRLKVGDHVKLTDSSTVLQQDLFDAFFNWDNRMLNMIGNIYEVRSLRNNNRVVGRVVGIDSPNGEQNGIWLFPKISFTCTQTPPPPPSPPPPPPPPPPTRNRG